ncbi:MAG: hypothetical protein RLZZ08_498 [Pseudomonadota bacterium]|jgi:hypothetical protein
MNVAPPRFPPIPPATGLSASSTSLKWAALTEAGTVVAALAGAEAERITPEVRNFPALIRDTEDWRRELAENGIADLAAMMEPGMAALLAVSARGADPGPAALALWREFTRARTAILALQPPAGALGPRRSA